MSTKLMTMNQRMAHLRDSFPSLRGRFTEGKFDAQELADFVQSPAATTGSSHAAKFLLSVWSGAWPLSWVEDDGPRRIEVDEYRWPWGILPFDMQAAMQGWDDSHRQAFLSWVRGPFWP